MTRYYHGATKEQVVTQYERRAAHLEQHFGEPLPKMLVNNAAGSGDLYDRLVSGDIAAHDQYRRTLIDNDRETAVRMRAELAE